MTLSTTKPPPPPHHKMWLDSLIRQSITNRWCTKIYCTTCGCGPFRTALAQAAQKQIPNPEDRNSEQAVLQTITLGLRQLDGDANYEYESAVRLILFLLDESGRNRSVLQNELDGTWAGDVLRGMIAHHEGVQAGYAKRREYNRPEAVQERRAAKKAVKQAAHQERLARKKERDVIWKMHHPM